ncbi:MAG: glycosyltransferase family 1 protein [Pyrinomonadaceae bacterium]
MRIALDGIPLNQPLTGVGHYTVELARALAAGSPHDRFEIVSPLSFIPLPELSLSNLQLVKASVNVFTRRWWTVGLPGYVQRESLDIFHGTNFEVPLWRKCPTVLTIHDLSMLLFPAVHEKHRTRRARRRLPVMARAADMIITPGESVREEVCERLQVEPSKVVAIPEAPRDLFRPLPQTETLETRERLGIADDFLLFVGTIEPRKNLPTLVRAFSEVVANGNRSLQLVLAGRTGWLNSDLFELIRGSGVSDRIKLTGYLCDEDLRSLYSSCRLFVYPSLYEGFGLPPLEAMACGAPAIVSRIPSIMAVTGDAACLVSPENTVEMAQSVVELLNDEAKRRQLSAAGIQRSSQFSWRRTAELTRDVYREAMDRFSKAN